MQGEALLSALSGELPEISEDKKDRMGFQSLSRGEFEKFFVTLP